MFSADSLITESTGGRAVLAKAGRRLASIPGIFWLLPICAALLTTRYLTTNVDSDWYLIRGRMIAEGYGYVSETLVPHYNRGPLFSYLIGFVFRIFGTQPELIGYVTRAFYMFNLLVLYGIGSRLYGRLAGFFVFFLALTAYTIHKTSPYILLDHVLPFFILFSVFMTVLAVQKSSAALPFVAGVSLGLAYLTKESTLMYLPLPCILLFQKRYSIGKRFLRTVTAYIGFGAAAAPWIYYVTKNSPSMKAALVHLMGGGVRSSAASALGSGAETVHLWDRIGSIINSIVNYHIHTIPQDFVIAPMFLVGVALLITTLVVRKRFSGVEIILAALILTFPLNAYLGSHTMRVGQSITYYYLLLAACSSVIGVPVVIFKAWKNKTTVHPGLYKAAAWGLPILLAIAIITFQVHREKGFVEALQGKGLYGITYYKSPGMELNGAMGAAQFESAKWIDKHLADTDKILISDSLWGAMILGGISRDQIRFVWLHPGANNTPRELDPSGGSDSFPFIVINPFDDKQHFTLDSQRRLFAPLLSDHDRPVFIFTLPAQPDHFCIAPDGTIQSNRSYFCGIWIFLENMFIDYLTRANIRYIAIRHANRYLNDYMMRNKGFQLEFEDERPTGSVRIYRVVAPQPLGEPFLMVGDQIPVYLERLKKYHPDKYEKFRQEVLVDFLHLDPDQMNQVLTGEGPSFHTY